MNGRRRVCPLAEYFSLEWKTLLIPPKKNLSSIMPFSFRCRRHLETQGLNDIYKLQISEYHKRKKGNVSLGIIFHISHKYISLGG